MLSGVYFTGAVDSWFTGFSETPSYYKMSFKWHVFFGRNGTEVLETSFPAF